MQYQARPSQPQYHLQASSLNLDSLHRDIEDLISRTKDDFVRDISNTELQTRLKALVDLQAVLKNQQLPPEALQAVRNQVRDLQMSQRPQMQTPTPMPLQNPIPNPVQPTIPGPQIPYSTPVHAPQYPPPPPPQIVHSQATPEPQNPQTPSTAALASLLASVQRSTQSQRHGHSQLSNSVPTPQTPAPASFGSGENPLFAQLRAAGLLQSNVNGNASSTAVPPVLSTQTPPSQSQPVNLSDLLRQVVTKPSKQSSLDHVELTSASLKM